jgi:HSP20 family molecular chaperone IbpA
MTLIQRPSEFDILIKNLFDVESDFNTPKGFKSPHPVDIFEDESGLTLEIACTGLTKEEIDIKIEGDVLHVNYNKLPELKKERTYQVRGIARRAFNLAYKIAPKFNLAKSEASMSNGLLVITMPFADESKPKQLLIK